MSLLNAHEAGITASDNSCNAPMPRKRKGRPVNGVLVLNKPQGVTSNRILQMVKRHYFAAKAGHTGSLDPLATGVLPICHSNYDVAS